MRPPPRRPSGSSPLSWLLILGVLGLVLALPLLGAWVASTLLIDHGASQRWAAAAGVALCLGLPLAWEVRLHGAEPRPLPHPGLRGPSDSPPAHGAARGHGDVAAG
jgi:hypothetical protein